jgi:hypothetical protein
VQWDRILWAASGLIAWTDAVPTSAAGGDDGESTDTCGTGGGPGPAGCAVELVVRLGVTLTFFGALYTRMAPVIRIAINILYGHLISSPCGGGVGSGINFEPQRRHSIAASEFCSAQ